MNSEVGRRKGERDEGERVRRSEGMKKRSWEGVKVRR